MAERVTSGDRFGSPFFPLNSHIMTTLRLSEIEREILDFLRTYSVDDLIEHLRKFRPGQKVTGTLQLFNKLVKHSAKVWDVSKDDILSVNGPGKAVDARRGIVWLMKQHSSEKLPNNLLAALFGDLSKETIYAYEQDVKEWYKNPTHPAHKEPLDKISTIQKMVEAK